MPFEKVDYEHLNARQKEIFNFQKLSSVLADLGYQTLLLSDDWNGADFLAIHFETGDLLKVQLKSRFGINKKYNAKDIWIAFPDKSDWYLFPHDEVVSRLAVEKPEVLASESWSVQGAYSWKIINCPYNEFLSSYRLLK